jgi:hypothetical protein
VSVCTCGGLGSADEDDCPKHGWLEVTKGHYDGLRAFVEAFADGDYHLFCGANPMMDDGPCGCAKGRAGKLLGRTLSGDSAKGRES